MVFEHNEVDQLAISRQEGTWIRPLLAFKCKTPDGLLSSFITHISAPFTASEGQTLQLTFVF